MECLVEHDYKPEEDDELELTKGDTITDVVEVHEGWWEGLLKGKRGLFPDNFVKVLHGTVSGKGIPSQKTNEISGTGDSEPILKLRDKTAQKSARRVKAVFSYAPAQDDELRLEVGDVIEFLDEIEEGWWKGNLRGQVGIFPSNFVQELETINQNGNETKQVTGDPDQPFHKEKAKKRESFTTKTKAIPDLIPAETTSIPMKISLATGITKAEEESAPKLPPKPVRETVRCFYPYSAVNDDELSLAEGDIITIISKECEDEGWWRGELRGKIGVFPDNFVELITSSTNPSLPTTPTKMTASERASSIISGNVVANTETKQLPPTSLPISGDAASSNIVDGSTSSKHQQGKLENKISAQIKSFGMAAAASKKLNSPGSPIGFGVGFFHKTKSPPPAVPTTGLGTTALHGGSGSPTGTTHGNKEQDFNFNAIERASDKLNHLTVTRAKAPSGRRPPSTILTREEEDELNMKDGKHLMNGTVSLPPIIAPSISGTTGTASASLDRDTTPAMQIGSAVTSGTTAPINNQPASLPTTASVNKPKTAIPWMAELKLKQDTKKTSGTSPTGPAQTPVQVGSNTNNPSGVSNNVSTVVVSPPGPPTISSGVNSGAGPTTKAPPLPAKPTVLENNVLKRETGGTGGASSAINRFSSGGHGLTTSTSTTAQPPASVTSNIKKLSSGSTDGSNPSGWVTIEEHNQLKERVLNLETELEVLRRHIKNLQTEREAHIV